MNRTHDKQVRLGKKERKTVTSTKTKLKSYVLSAANKKKREVRLNDYLMGHLKQNPRPIAIESSGIPSATFMGETFRPEGFVKQSGRKRQGGCILCRAATPGKLGG